MATSIYFKSEAHKARFLGAIQQLGRVYDRGIDQEYGAALYTLTSDHALWEKVQTYVESDAIYIQDMLQEVDLSGGQSVLVKLAGNLFNSEQHLDPIELMRLDDSNFLVALTALQIRRVSLPIDDFKA